MLFRKAAFNKRVASSPGIRGCPKVTDIDNDRFSVGLVSRTMGLKARAVVRRIANVHRRTSCGIVMAARGRCRYGDVVLTANIARHRLKIPKRRHLANTKISCYTAYSKVFFQKERITIIKNKDATLRSTRFLSGCYDGICLVREESRFQKRSRVMGHLRRGRGMRFVLGAAIRRVYKRRVIRDLQILGGMAKRRSRLTISKVFMTIKRVTRGRGFTSIIRLSRNKFVITKRSYGASRTKVCTTKSYQAGRMHRLAATTTSNTMTTLTTYGCVTSITRGWSCSILHAWLWFMVCGRARGGGRMPRLMITSYNAYLD